MAEFHIDYGENVQNLGKQQQDLVLNICKLDCDYGIEVLMSLERWGLVWAGRVRHFRRVKYTKH